MIAGTSDLTYPLDPLEIAVGLALEPVRRERVRPPAAHGHSPREVLEEVLLEAMSNGRASVSFSGGRDSSLILAVACRVARRHGLEDPVAITMRHDSAESEESRWQERVVAHLRVREWVKVGIGDTMDALGAQASELLAATGVLAPPNAYLHLPVVRAAPAGTVLTGVGGDEILGSTGERLAQVVYGGARWRPRDALSVALAVAPMSIRRRWLRLKQPMSWPWLTEQARAAVAERLAHQDASVRVRWDTVVTRHARSRSAQLGNKSLDAVGSVYGRRVVSALHTPAFVDAFAWSVGASGPKSRTAAMRSIAADLLPDDVLDRQTKAAFGAMVWGPETRAAIESWSAEDLPCEVRELLDEEGLRRTWSRPDPHFATLMLVQRAWLHTHGRS